MNEERYWRALVDRDHDEALSIVQQVATANDPAITPHHVIDLNRFCETCEDGEGYDVPKERMKALKAVGLVVGGRGGWYSTSECGNAVRAVWFDPPTPAHGEEGA